MTRPRLAKSPSYNSRIERVMEEADDFLLPREIHAQLPDLQRNDIHRALCSLHHYKAAGFMSEGGKTYWFRTPETDTRCRKVEEHVIHGPGSRGGRKPRVRTTASPDKSPSLPTNLPDLAAALDRVNDPDFHHAVMSGLKETS